ncbi:MAG: ATP-dependent zinc metalloprotease FtsH [Actinomycetota bacterium]
MKKPAKSARTLRLLLISLLVLAASFAILTVRAYKTPAVAREMSIDELYALSAKGQIRLARLLDEDAVVVGKVCRGNPGRTVLTGGPGQPPGPPCKPPYKPFQASYPKSDVSTSQMIERMAAGGAEVKIDKQTSTAITKSLLSVMFPLLVLANLFGIIFVAKGGDSTMAEIAGFGKIRKGKKNSKDDRPSTGVTFEDVGGAEEALVELREVTDYLKDPEKFEEYGASVPKGVLLFGPPGCGKTLLARAVAGEAGVPFFPVSGAEFVESLVGVGAARVRDLFAQVKEVAPAIVFIDEIDAVGRKRGGEGSTGGEREQTVNQLLVELDGFEANTGIVLMGATNRPDILDPALLRPGRFDRHVTLETPDLHGRQTILELHAKTKPIEGGVDFEHLARRTPGFTGADLANVINEGALLAVRKGPGNKIGMEELTEAVQRVLHGPMRRGTIMGPEERKRIAYHEAGHALAASALGQAASVQRVSIVARGRGLGSSAIDDQDNRVLFTTSEMRASLVVTMAGIAAEQVVFGETSTTAKDDLERANAVAREMVGVQGMSGEIGPLRLLSTEGGYLGADARVVEAISGQTLGAFDAAVRALIDDAQANAQKVLVQHRVHLDQMAVTLVDQETLEGAPLEALLAGVNAEEANFSGNGVSFPEGSRRKPRRPPRAGSAESVPATGPE